MYNTNPRYLPQDSRFLLKRDDQDLSDQSLLRKEYWVELMEATIKAGRKMAKWGGEPKELKVR